jgi:TolA-binding protein
MAHPTKALALVPLLLLCLSSIPLAAQASNSTDYRGSSGPAADLKSGIDQFRTSQFDKAVPFLQRVIDDPAAGSLRADALLLVAKSYMSLGRLDDAGRNLDIYLAGYKGAADYPEALYQKGRLLFMQDDLEGALQSLQGFIAENPDSTFVSSAWFWAGESLYTLGRLDDATVMYAKIVSDFPTSVKLEAARYRIELIQVRKKEVELSRLLTWSHEDFLRTVEDYQNREKVYQQLIETYQKRLATAGVSEDDLKTIASLKEQLAQKSDEAARLSAQIAAAAAAPASPTVEELARLQQTLAAKEAALALKEQYLGLMESGSGGGN